MTFLSFLGIGFLALSIIFLYMAVQAVPQGFSYTIERFGKYSRLLEPGLSVIIPFFDRVARRMNMQEQVLEVPTQEVITKDNAMVSVDGVVFFQVLDAARAAYEVRNLEYATLNLAMTNIRTVMGSMDLDELLSQRDQINARLLSVMDDAMMPWGVKVTRVEIKDMTPPQDIVDSMARQMKAERDKRAVILEAEGTRQSEILEAEGQKRSAILEAEGRKEAAFRDAEAREREAQAEAEATRLVSQAISEGNIQAINYFVAERYVDALKALASSENQKVLMIPIEASGVMGAIGGMTEIFREAGAPSGQAPSGGAPSGGGSPRGGSPRGGTPRGGTGASGGSAPRAGAAMRASPRAGKPESPPSQDQPNPWK